MHGSQKCCGELAELTVDDIDIWQIADAAGDKELRRLAHSLVYVTSTACHRKWPIFYQFSLVAPQLYT